MLFQEENGHPRKLKWKNALPLITTTLYIYIHKWTTYSTKSKRALDTEYWSAGCVNRGAAPETPPILKSEYTPTCPFTWPTSRTHWKIAFNPLMRHGRQTLVIFENFRAHLEEVRGWMWMKNRIDSPLSVCSFVTKVTSLTFHTPSTRSTLQLMKRNEEEKRLDSRMYKADVFGFRE